MELSLNEEFLRVYARGFCRRTIFKKSSDMMKPARHTEHHSTKHGGGVLDLVRLLRLIKHASKIVVTSHQNSDVDAVLSCYVIKELINRLNPSANINIVTSGMNLQAKKVVESLGISLEIQEGSVLLDYDVCIFVDVNNPMHIGALKDYIIHDKPIVIIDHHKPSINMPQNALTIIDEKAVAAAEVVCDLIRYMDFKPTKEEAQCLLVGILSDSRRLSIGSIKTLRNMAFLLSCGASLSEAIAVLGMPMNFSEKIARLKASQRASIYCLGQWIIAISNVGSYEASAARALIDLGADVAAVCNELNGEVRLCIRASEDFAKRTNIHLGEILERLSLSMSGSGGGHATAACATIPRRYSEVVSGLLNLLSDALGHDVKKMG
ncbi:MAG: DHH family phosphoesterase [Candidatus Nezhaarchaeales archaeon]